MDYATVDLTGHTCMPGRASQASLASAVWRLDSGLELRVTASAVRRCLSPLGGGQTSGVVVPGSEATALVAVVYRKLLDPVPSGCSIETVQRPTIGGNDASLQVTRLLE